MQSGSLARRYARAVFELGLSKGTLDKIGSDLRDLAGAMASSSELVSLLSNPAIRKADRRKVVDALLVRVNADGSTKNLLGLLLDGERLANLPSISRELDAMIEAKAGRVNAEIISAQPLTPDAVARLTVTLEKLSGKQVVVTRREDPRLLGGLIAKVGDVVYDGSLATQLRSLRDNVSPAT